MAGQWGRKLETWAGTWRRQSGWRERANLAVVLKAQADVMLWDAVDQARAEGASWTEIGAALGMTRQSAWERFGGGS